MRFEAKKYSYSLILAANFIELDFIIESPLSKNSDIDVTINSYEKTSPYMTCPTICLFYDVS